MNQGRDWQLQPSSHQRLRPDIDLEFVALAARLPGWIRQTALITAGPNFRNPEDERSKDEFMTYRDLETISTIHLGYRRLACAIIREAIKDLKSGDITQVEIAAAWLRDDGVELLEMIGIEDPFKIVERLIEINKKRPQRRPGAASPRRALHPFLRHRFLIAAFHSLAKRLELLYHNCMIFCIKVGRSQPLQPGGAGPARIQKLFSLGVLAKIEH